MQSFVHATQDYAQNIHIEMKLEILARTWEEPSRDVLRKQRRHSFNDYDFVLVQHSQHQDTSMRCGNETHACDDCCHVADVSRANTQVDLLVQKLDQSSSFLTSSDAGWKHKYCHRNS